MKLFHVTWHVLYEGRSVYEGEGYVVALDHYRALGLMQARLAGEFEPQDIDVREIPLDEEGIHGFHWWDPSNGAV